MENLSPEGKTLYELFKMESAVVYEERFLAHKKEVLNAMGGYVADTQRQFREMGVTIGSVQGAMGAEIAEVKSSIGKDLDGVKSMLSADITALTAMVERAMRPSFNSAVGPSLSTN